MNNVMSNLGLFQRQQLKGNQIQGLNLSYLNGSKEYTELDYEYLQLLYSEHIAEGDSLPDIFELLELSVR